MDKLLKFIVQEIVQNPSAVEIEKQFVPVLNREGADSEEKEKKLINFLLKVDPEDLKIVIGKQGRTIKAIRNLLRVVAIKQKTQVNLELQEA